MTRRAFRNRKSQDQPQSANSFFSQKTRPAIQRKKEGAFFQAKLTVGEPDDKYEKEADSVAHNVVSNTGSGAEVVQKKEISSIQRLSTSMEDEMAGTDEERMRRDKELQRKPEIQMETKPLEEEDKEMGGASVQRKPDAGSNTASRQVSSRIEQTAGKGKALPAKTLGDMQSSFGLGFSQVNVHTDADSVAMNKELGAQAFTHRNDIYFNSGKYNPDSAEGKRLLAHELTHVVQQGAADNSEKENAKRP